MTTFYGTSALKRQRRSNAELDQIDAAIHEIAEAESPVSVRGLFYRVMSRGLVPKSEIGYKVVQRQALKMRRAGDLPYSWITDGSRLRLQPNTWDSASQALEVTAELYRRALWFDQAVHVEVWSEKDAIRGVVYPVTSQYDVPLMIAKGFPSETFLHETASEITAEGKHAVIYQLGDHDPSGVAAWDDIKTKLRRFVPDDIELTFERLAVTREQITELDLPTRPTKQSDSRAAKFDGDPSSKLREIVGDAIERWIDPAALHLTRVAERSEKEILRRIAGDWDYYADAEQRHRHPLVPQRRRLHRRYPRRPHHRHRPRRRRHQSWTG
jgi:hypothetical protein